MQPETPHALKEWAAVERALAAGATSLLIRKGGIREGGGSFAVERRTFWIFPTRYHQNAREIARPFAGFLDAAAALDPGPDRVRLQLHAVVESAYRIRALDAALALEGLHPMAAETVEARFRYREPHLHALLVRVAALPEPRLIPNTLDYDGCISWVTLDVAVETDAVRPVLEAPAWDGVRNEVEARLSRSGVVRIAGG